MKINSGLLLLFGLLFFNTESPAQYRPEYNNVCPVHIQQFYPSGDTLLVLNTKDLGFAIPGGDKKPNWRTTIQICDLPHRQTVAFQIGGTDTFFYPALPKPGNTPLVSDYFTALSADHGFSEFRITGEDSLLYEIDEYDTSLGLKQRVHIDNLDGHDYYHHGDTIMYVTTYIDSGDFRSILTPADSNLVYYGEVLHVLKGDSVLLLWDPYKSGQYRFSEIRPEYINTDTYNLQNPLDPWHINSLNITPDGNYILSLRNIGICEISPIGKMLFKYGGYDTSFPVIHILDSTSFYRQHDVQEYKLNGKYYLRVFSNGDRLHPFADGLIYRIDKVNKTATLVSRRRIMAGLSPSMGSYRQHNGTSYLNYGAKNQLFAGPEIRVFCDIFDSATGRLNGRLSMDRGQAAYRVIPLNWQSPKAMIVQNKKQLIANIPNPDMPVWWYQHQSDSSWTWVATRAILQKPIKNTEYKFETILAPDPDVKKIWHLVSLPFTFISGNNSGMPDNLQKPR